jgi:hypothetical protein
MFFKKEVKMLKSINQYKLKPNITKEDLIKAGFKEGGWQSKFKKPKVYYFAYLTDDISLNIEIETDTMKFNCIDNVFVLDEAFCQAYSAFYADNEFDYLNKVIKKYNIVMDRFVEKGIFKKVERNKILRWIDWLKKLFE